jgi:hypothetical protein
LLFWGTRTYLAAKYRIRYRISGERRWALKHGTPDRVTLLMPWLEFLGWLALLGFVLCWLLNSVPVLAFLVFEVPPRVRLDLSCARAY